MHFFFLLKNVALASLNKQRDKELQKKKEIKEKSHFRAHAHYVDLIYRKKYIRLI